MGKVAPQPERVQCTVYRTMSRRLWILGGLLAVPFAFAQGAWAAEPVVVPVAATPADAPPPSSASSSASERSSGPASNDVLADDPILAHQPEGAVPPPEGLGDLVGTFARTMLMLLAVLALVYLTLHKGLGKLTERSQSGKRMRVVERVGLDARRGLYIVEVDGREMLIGTGEGGPVHLCALGPASHVVPEPNATFQDALEHQAVRETTSTAAEKEPT